MRLSVAVAVACLTIVSLSVADPSHASIKKRTDIQAQELGMALRSLAKDRGFQIVYLSDTVEKLHTAGAVGEFTTDQALKKLLSGSGLDYKYVDDNTVSIFKHTSSPTTSGAGEGQGGDATNSSSLRATSGGQGNEDSSAAGDHKSFWSRLRLAQSSNRTDASVDNSPSPDSRHKPETPAPESSDSEKLEQITVTAQKREENLQDIPISISAIGGRRIEELGLQSLNDLMGMVPGVSFSAVSPGQGNLVIRGIATGDIAATINNRKEAVGLYINDTPVGQPRFNPDISPFDLERVEVLRGPQGTLYGSGSLAGAVRFITRKPNTQEFESKAGADVSFTKRGGINHRLDAMVNFPLSNTFALRVVGYEHFDDGYIRGVGPAYHDHDANDVKQYGGRAALRWAPNDKFTADLSAMIQRLNDAMTSEDNEGYVRGGISVGPYEQYRDTKVPVRNRFNLYNLTMDYDLGWGNLTSSTSLLENENDSATDLTAAIQLFFGVDRASTALNFVSTRDLSQELRIATDLQGPLNFIGGVFYIDQKRGQYLPTPTPGFDAAYTIPTFGVDSTAFGAPVDDPYNQTVHIDERQVALFGELKYEMTEKLSATVGLRWFDVAQDYFIANSGVVANGNPPLNKSSGESGFKPKFLVSYALSDDVLVSAQAAQGFRLGGTNEQVPPLFCGAQLAALGLTKAPDVFRSENVWDYELNAKSSWLGRRLTVNGSVYHIDYKDIQVPTPLSCGFTFTGNAASARSRGAELELTSRPLQGLDLSIGGAYTDAELTVNVPQLFGKAGDQLPLSAKFTGNATARYEFPLSGAIQGFAQYSYRYTDRVLFSFNPEANPATQGRPAPAYDLHNIRLGIRSGSRTATLYLNNVFDKEVVTYQRTILGLERFKSRGQPRTVGLSISASF